MHEKNKKKKKPYDQISIEITNNNETRFTPPFKINSLRYLITEEHHFT